MIIKKMVLFLLLLIMACGSIACHRQPTPPLGAKGIEEKEMRTGSDTSTKTGKPAAGGGRQINEAQW